jgi:predicted dehydrogenase/aryl-alcohol dehydrogenase-like predicted oxidoreductase
MANTLNWGLLGVGAIAKAFAKGLAQSSTGKAFAAGSRDAAKAAAFAKDFDMPRSYGSYETLLADPDVHAVYISTPHPMHAEWSIKALRAGKHVLCEKPFTVNLAEATAVAEEAKLQKRFVMEAFMYRCHPQTARLVEIIREGHIGEVRLIRAGFTFQAGFDPKSRLFDNDLAGGGILDVGGYTTSIVRLVAGAALGTGVAEPTFVTGVGHLGPTGVDHWAAATLKFPRGIIAQLSTGVEINSDSTLYVFGSKGHLRVPNPYVANRSNPDNGKIIIHKNGEPPREEIIEAGCTSFAYEADAFAVGVETGTPPYPAQAIDDTLGNMRTLDRWRNQLELAYQFELPEGYPKTRIDGSHLSVNADAVMVYDQIKHLDRKVSRLILGCDNQRTFPHAAIQFDDFFAKGGNTFDTAFIYNSGMQERLLGEWIKLRGVRDQVNVIVKGCHTPLAFPNILTVQLKESLKRLQIETADIYMMHRDNLDVPVSEWVDVLNEHVKAGRLKAFGGSNWSLARVQEANDYAKSKGLQGFSVVSNNFSLARMVNPVWNGCVAASDPESRQWFERTRLGLLAWSSQARGFFLPGRAAPEKTDDRELVHCWYSDDNFQRLARANELAAKKGVTPINIALAYVLNQPFPTFALVGPRQLEELRTSLPGLTVKLSPDEVKWLNLEA